MVGTDRLAPVYSYGVEFCPGSELRTSIRDGQRFREGFDLAQSLSCWFGKSIPSFFREFHLVKDGV